MILKEGSCYRVVLNTGDTIVFKFIGNSSNDIYELLVFINGENKNIFDVLRPGWVEFEEVGC